MGEVVVRAAAEAGVRITLIDACYLRGGFSEELDPDYRHASLDIALATRAHSQGLGSEALRVAARHLFDERAHHRITIDPAADNAKAIRAYERVGFRPVGLLRSYERGADGTWHDGLLMDLLAADFDG